jgi:hypothetical protein
MNMEAQARHESDISATVTIILCSDNCVHCDHLIPIMGVCCWQLASQEVPQTLDEAPGASDMALQDVYCMKTADNKYCYNAINTSTWAPYPDLVKDTSCNAPVVRFCAKSCHESFQCDLRSVPQHQGFGGEHSPRSLCVYACVNHVANTCIWVWHPHLKAFLGHIV